MGLAEVAAAGAAIAIAAMYARNMSRPAQYATASDGREYLVLRLPDHQLAAEALGSLNAMAMAVMAAIERDLGSPGGGGEGGSPGGGGADARAVLRNLRSRYRPEALSEGGTDTSVTSFSVGKGQRVVICLRQRDHQGRLGGLEGANTLAYVMLHELAHLATDEIGHVPAFWDNFRFLIDVAEREGMYSKVDYFKAPQGYCGITISSSASFPRGGSHGTSGGSGEAPGGSGEAPGGSGEAPGGSGEAPG